MTLRVQLIPDSDARCAILLEGDQRCERYSVGAKLTGQLVEGSTALVTVRLCSDHAAQVATMVDGRSIVGATEASS